MLHRLTHTRLLMVFLLGLATTAGTAAADESAEFRRAVAALPDSEVSVSLFDGSLNGWEGDPRYWSVRDGMIRGANSAAVPSSTYLFTKKRYRNFRLLLEVRQTVGPGYSTMHSAVAALGARFTEDGGDYQKRNDFGFRGPLLMFCHDWGIWDAHGRNRVVPRGAGPQAENRGDWNLVEILVTGNRIQFAVNGVAVFDFTDDGANLKESPIGLQLHSNQQPQEYHFRGLVLTENPTNQLVSVVPGWTESVSLQPSVERGAVAENKAAEAPGITVDEFRRGGRATWIWGPDDNRSYQLVHQFDLTEAATAGRLMASCDNVGKVFINDRQVAMSAEWQQPMTADVSEYLRTGRNTIRADVQNQGGVAAFVLKLVWKDESGKLHHMVSDSEWKATDLNTSQPAETAVRGQYGDGPWGPVFDNAAATGRVPQGTFELPPGFVVEKLFTVPRDELGSWVCITFDDRGRLYASDQGGKGICRIIPADLSGDSPTRVQKLDFSGCEFQPSGAQGMLWAFDSLYFCCNGGPGSGLYRARDTDGDDQFDECVRLKSFRGGGEHGPHSLRLSPDGKRIFVIAGNHTDPPFKAGEEYGNQNYSSRIPTNWAEDLLLPRMWDANGHARGKLAPGGWIASTDPDGETWDLFSVGYRNPYDMAFNADGELFAYDADMEWDVGTPWYRPTRVVHATSGSEFGWRSGTGKWPVWYIDSQPPLVNIGPGSPVGVDFGYGAPVEQAAARALSDRTVPCRETPGHSFVPLKFPHRYQKALYICDWTFGTMYAVFPVPDQSTYTAEKEEFLSRTPLPLTDVAAGPDGYLYFTIGGRGTQSELYRVRYTGNESITPAALNDTAFAEARQHRRMLETFHGSAPKIDDSSQLSPETNDFLDSVSADVLLGDRALTTASRLAFQNSQILWEGLTTQTLGMVDLSEVSDTEAINAIVALAKAPAEQIAARQGTGSAEEWKSAARRACLRTLVEDCRWDELSTRNQLDYLRALSLVFLRLGPPAEEERMQLLSSLDPVFPCNDDRLNRELCQMLVYLGSERVVHMAVSHLNEPPDRQNIDMGELLTRNAGYGRAIRAMIDNQPDRLQIWYAFCLRVADTGWTTDLRTDYFRWFGRAREWSGGNSFRKFLSNIEEEAWNRTRENDRILVEAAGARTPYQAPELPKPEGPGHPWTTGEVVALTADGLKDRSFENGRKIFAAARCVLCHRFAGDGGATGPDLTQLAGRFNVRALTEAIVEPSKVISDQYRATTMVLADGRAVTGRVVSENSDQLSVLMDPEDSTKVMDIARSEIEESVPSGTSLMPAKLLEPLNRDEVLDLMAYLLSRGDERHPMFRK